ncbi:MAG: 6-bladed beta-propeller [Deltaproteobacteria bacterium]|nr:6-bladed beta-propeller [Deltaproteobacteria bacterium]
MRARLCAISMAAAGAALACGCFGPDPAARAARSGARAEIVWPEPPDRARIRYVGSVESPADLGIETGVLSRAVRLITGRDDGRFVRPHAVAAGGGLLAVADPGAGGVHLFDTVRNSYAFVPGASGGSFGSPVGVAVWGENVFVSDSERNIVALIDRQGAAVREIGGGAGLRRPAGLALGEGGELYVADAGNHRICVFSIDGAMLRQFGGRGTGPGQFNFPTNLWYDGLRRRLFVADALNFRVQVFDPSGAFTGAFGEPGDRPGYLARPRGVATDSDGNVHVVDALFDAVQIFNPEGALLLGYGRRGADAGEFWLPAGIHAGSDDRIYVADSYNRRVQIFAYLH